MIVSGCVTLAFSVVMYCCCLNAQSVKVACYFCLLLFWGIILFWVLALNYLQISQESNKIYAAMFAPFWNEIIKSLREEDFISNRLKTHAHAHEYYCVTLCGNICT